MTNKPLPFQGLNIRIPILIPSKGRGLIGLGSGLATVMVTLEVKAIVTVMVRLVLGTLEVAG